MNHSQWVNNEYQQWVKALSECTVHNVKDHPRVQRMLGEPTPQAAAEMYDTLGKLPDVIFKLMRMGTMAREVSSARVIRYAYYAQEILKRGATSICEIGGGIGEFYAVLRAMGYEGDYRIVDIGEVKKFQNKYLDEVEKQTYLKLSLRSYVEFDLLVSFYALGEFDDATKQSYRTIIDQTPHGYIAWNPHSGATNSLDVFSKHDIKVTPGIEPGISIITW